VAWYSSYAGIITGVVDPYTKIKKDAKKKPPNGGFRRYFSFLFLRAKPPSSGAKVKKETENSSIHACSYLIEQC
jgi:hypothetical protein